jgi:hypothetical protein
LRLWTKSVGWIRGWRAQLSRQLSRSGSKSVRWVSGCWGFWRTAFTEEASNLLCNGFLTGRAKHASGVDAMLLGELAGTREDSSLVEDVLHGFKDVLSTRRRRGIRVLLATHYHLNDFAQLNWWQVSGFLDLVDL